MGYEFSGHVTDVGGSVSDLDPGDAVAVNPILYCGKCRQCREGNYQICDSVGFIGLSGGGGGFAENVVVDAEKAVPLGEDVPVEYGALVEPLSVGLHAVRRSGLRAGDASPCSAVSHRTGRDPVRPGGGHGDDLRLGTARSPACPGCGLRADVLVDPAEADAVEYVASNTGGGVDISFEVAGVEASFNAAIESTAPGGRTTVVSI